MAGITLDPNSLTIEEMEEICAVMGIEDVRELQKLGNSMPPRMLRCVAWMTKRREDPTFTMEAAGRMQVGELMELMNDPNAAGGTKAASSGGSSGPSAISTATRRPNSGASRKVS